MNPAEINHDIDIKKTVELKYKYIYLYTFVYSCIGIKKKDAVWGRGRNAINPAEINHNIDIKKTVDVQLKLKVKKNIIEDNVQLVQSPQSIRLVF
jgi:hypothetical protein